MSIALNAIGGAAISSPSGTDSSTTKKKGPPRREIVAKPDFALLPEPR